ncbi:MULTISPECIES: response regulator transcription factor [Aequorivita]|uniref:Response regulator transcription factor n=2 Tax=Aequorivita TaxID=153265 RepID=A0AB35YSZ0_9FLAO|nr:response regulator transcription factor [Aequorivita sp. Ant34-E75]WGF92857.1 response regulator transcription factor [Aequorivita sp. Ant34-E75]
MKRVVIADHHAMIREGISVFLKTTHKYTVVGNVSRGTELIECIEKTKPDILILELNIPEIKGFNTLRHIHETFPKIKIVIFSSYPEVVYALRTIKSGASGYIPKTASPAEFLEALNHVNLGGIFLNDALIAAYNNRNNNDTSVIGKYKKLSARELEVLNLLSDGKRNKDIASLLEINEKTVSTYKTRLLKKLEVNSLAELITQVRMLQLS